MLRAASLGGWLVLLCVPSLLACGGAGAAYPRTSSMAQAEYQLSAEPVDYAGGYGAASGYDVGPAIQIDDRVARMSASQPPADVAATTVPPSSDRTDARDTSGPLLIYTATLHMAVFEVRATQLQILERVRSMGGVLSMQTDDRLVVRVPAESFEALLGGIGELGDVLHRDIQAEDVGEEFRDVAIRIRNLEVTRQRVEALLAQATTVDQALSIQRELERITMELEAMRGRQRFLADRVAFSTITFVFQPRPREALEQPEIFQLPFGWLEQLGLSSLLEVR